MHQLDPNAGANGGYRMSTRLEEAQLRRSMLDRRVLDRDSSTAGRSQRRLKDLVTRLTTRLGNHKRADETEEPVSDRDGDSLRQGEVGSEPKMVVVDVESFQPAQPELEPEIARSGQAASVKTP
jgi:hypothetical protein